MGIIKPIAIFMSRLTKFKNDEPLTKLALSIVIILDIFILTVIFGGLSAHTAQLTSPEEYFPYNCESIFIEKQWSEVNKLDRLQDLILSDYNNYSYTYDSAFDKSKIEKMHHVCRNFYESINKIHENPVLKNMFIKRQELLKKKSQLIHTYKNDKAVYDTSLLETIAEKNNASLDNISTGMQNVSKEIEANEESIVAINRQINEDKMILSLWPLMRIGDYNFRQNMIEELNRYKRMYLFKELVWQLLFMLPLFVIFYFWHVVSIKKNSNVKTLISSHLLIISLIPIVLKIIQVVLELIPFHFFMKLFKLLESLHIIALWHYIVIFVAIGVVIFFIYLIQKNLFSKKRLYEKRLMKGECCFCGKTLPRMVNICPFCGTNQFKKCVNCNSDTFFGGEYCVNCGKSSVGIGDGSI